MRFPPTTSGTYRSLVTGVRGVAATMPRSASPSLPPEAGSVASVVVPSPSTLSGASEHLASYISSGPHCRRVGIASRPRVEHGA